VIVLAVDEQIMKNKGQVEKMEKQVKGEVAKLFVHISTSSLSAHTLQIETCLHYVCCLVERDVGSARNVVDDAQAGLFTERE